MSVINTKFKQISLLLIGSIFVIVFIVGMLYPRQIKRIIKKLIAWDAIFYDSSCKNCEELFQDGVAEHENAYRYEGIKPRDDFKDLQKLLDRRILMEIKTSENYEVVQMDASLPGLLPKGYRFINRLAREYRARCIQNKLAYVPFRITSAVRTKESVKALRKRNGNAIENSAHLKGKTIDISYLFKKTDLKQKELFIQSLAKLKDEGLCYVKYETNMKCLHITCR